MREINFRIWNKNKKKFLFYSLGDLLCGYAYDDNINIKQDLHLLKFNQFTGLKDKNGKEIYEGDIIKQIHFGRHLGQDKAVRHETIQEIVFNEGSFNVMLIPFNYEIIGNIYENPELCLNPEKFNE